MLMLVRDFGIIYILILCTACSSHSPPSSTGVCFIVAENLPSSPPAKPDTHKHLPSKQTSLPATRTATASRQKPFASKPSVPSISPSPHDGHKNAGTPTVSSTSNLSKRHSPMGMNSAALAKEVFNGILLEYTASEITFRSVRSAKASLSLFEDAVILTRVRSALAGIPLRPSSLVSSAYVRAGMVILQIPSSTDMAIIAKVLNVALECSGVSSARILLLAD